ncbi:hypothetical protein EniLVp02_0003 [Vibrio phage EniLVp02]
MLNKIFAFLAPFAAKLLLSFLLTVVIPFFKKCAVATSFKFDDKVIIWFEDSVAMIYKAINNGQLPVGYTREPLPEKVEREQQQSK